MVMDGAVGVDVARVPRVLIRRSCGWRGGLASGQAERRKSEDK